MQTATIQKEEIQQYEASYVYYDDDAFEESGPKGNKLYSYLISAIVLFVILVAFIGAISAYTSGLEIELMKKEQQIERLDEKIIETKSSIDVQYNNLLLNMEMPKPGKMNKGYYVRDNWEVGG